MFRRFLNNHKNSWIAGFTAILALLLTSSVVFGAEELVINGSTTVLPIAQKAAEVYMKENPDVSISVSGSCRCDVIYPNFLFQPFS